MVCEYFYEKLGNAIVVFIGEGYEISKFWFAEEGESESPLNQAEAETLARRMVEYLNKEHPITEDMVEKYGDSEQVKENIRERDESASSTGIDELRAKMLLASLLCGGKE